MGVVEIFIDYQFLKFSPLAVLARDDNEQNQSRYQKSLTRRSQSLGINALAREHPPALQTPLRHLTSPIHLCTWLTGALSLGTDTSEAHRFSRQAYSSMESLTGC